MFLIFTFKIEKHFLFKKPDVDKQEDDVLKLKGTFDFFFFKGISYLKRKEIEYLWICRFFD